MDHSESSTPEEKQHTSKPDHSDQEEQLHNLIQLYPEQQLSPYIQPQTTPYPQTDYRSQVSQPELPSNHAPSGDSLEDRPEFRRGRELFGQEKYDESRIWFEKAVRQEENMCGEDHVHTIDSKFWLGKALLELRKYNQAEDLFRQIMRSEKKREKTGGKRAVDSIELDVWLGRALFGLCRYDAAEDLFRQAMHDLENLDKTDEQYQNGHVSPKLWLGYALHLQHKNSEAEELIRQALHDMGKMEETSGQFNAVTLDANIWLGHILHGLQRYSDAQEAYRQAERIAEREGKVNWVIKWGQGRALVELKKFKDAEEMLRQAVREVRGEDHTGYLISRVWVAKALYYQQKWSEAEQELREALDSAEKLEETNGEIQFITFEGRMMLGKTLHCQRKWSEAEQELRRAMDSAEKIGERNGEIQFITFEGRMVMGKTLFALARHEEAKEAFGQAERIAETANMHGSFVAEAKYALGKALFELKDSEAEVIFEEGLRVSETTLGKDHLLTLRMKIGLGRALCENKSYAEAVKVLRQAVRGRRKQFGEDKETISANEYLGMALFAFGQYSEAEAVYRQVVQAREKTSGENDDETIITKQRLAETLFKQNKFRDAADAFREVVSQHESKSGKDHLATILNRLWLGRTLFELANYQEAELLLRHVVHQLETSLGDHLHTLEAKHRLAWTLSRQEKYEETEALERDVVEGLTSALGYDHPGTLEARILLALATMPYKQKDHNAATGPLQSIVQEYTTFGQDHADTKSSEDVWEDALSSFASERLSNEQGVGDRIVDSPSTEGLNRDEKEPTVDPASTNRRNIQISTVADQLSSFFPMPQDGQKSYTDRDIGEIGRLLKQLNSRWSRVPRTYIVLRTIDQLNWLDTFLDLGYTDHWFPVTESILPESFPPGVRASFVKAQSLVLTQSLDLEKGGEGQHCYFRKSEDLPFQSIGVLGDGGFGQVDRVVSNISFKEYARKRVQRNTVYGHNPVGDKQKKHVEFFLAEIKIMKRLKHRHVVDFVGSYTDNHWVGLLMKPIADMDLKAYLGSTDHSKYNELRTFFGCLARALEFLHEKNVRHKDIKPQNILIHHGTVLFTDFGLAFDFTDASKSTTTGIVNGRSARYCAPEVFEQDPRNKMSDIWSLGAVFLEMVLVLKGKTLEYMDNFFITLGSHGVYLHMSFDLVPKLVAELGVTGELSDNVVFDWTQQMLKKEMHLRPTASSLVASITAPSCVRGFCGRCCLFPEGYISGEGFSGED